MLKFVVKSLKTLHQFTVQKIFDYVVRDAFGQFSFESIVSNGKLIDKQSSRCIKLDQWLLFDKKDGAKKN